MDAAGWSNLGVMATIAGAVANAVLALFTFRSVKASEKQVKSAFEQVELAKESANHSAEQLRIARSEYEQRLEALNKSSKPILYFFARRNTKYNILEFTVINIGVVSIVPEYFNITVIDSETEEERGWDYSKIIKGGDIFQTVLKSGDSGIIFVSPKDLSFIDIKARELRVALFFKAISENAAAQYISISTTLNPGMNKIETKTSVYNQ